MQVYIVQFDWATPDCSDIELYVYDSYEKAYSKFKEIIHNERNPELSWVGNIEFDDEGYPVDDHYEFDFKDSDGGESNLYWHITDKSDWYQYSNIDLLIKEVM